jgi:hypothetical protein
VSAEQDAVPPRSHSQISVYYRSLGADPVSTEYLTEPISISMRSFLMRSPEKLAVGSTLLLRIRVPIEISGSPFQTSRHTGQVVSEVALDDGTIAYRIEL